MASWSWRRCNSLSQPLPGPPGPLRLSLLWAILTLIKSLQSKESPFDVSQPHLACMWPVSLYSWLPHMFPTSSPHRMLLPVLHYWSLTLPIYCLKRNSLFHLNECSHRIVLSFIYCLCMCAHIPRMHMWRPEIVFLYKYPGLFPKTGSLFEPEVRWPAGR